MPRRRWPVHTDVHIEVSAELPAPGTRHRLHGRGNAPLLEAPERALEKSSVVVRSIGRLIKWWQQPHILMTGLSIGVAVGTAMSVYTGRIDFIGGPFVWAGCFIVLRRAWQKQSGWPEMLRSTPFWVGLALAVAGNIIESARSK